MTDDKRDRPTLPARRVPRPAPDLGRDPIDVPHPATSEAAAPTQAGNGARFTVAPAPKREVTVQLGTRVGERTKDLLDYLKTIQKQDIRVSIELAIEEKYGHLLPRDEGPI
ncbi:hypothetical protein [Curtobacterium flaccumfaciens]|uniref:hypothetical protein n=1 Tax=Curtobacterium flaccumfaciens TaxID=2035 RepID=UPI001BDF0A05|nr:hypothetical protein [Curtobacterium flaccumfaciens]MBT1631516.1 hypothetical protein [Curtobacterium flaccumfaciens pv. oortii]MCX2846824.1 hypothetical protein [Curtobacterium flaccumfaciens pv. oortii]